MAALWPELLVAVLFLVGDIFWDGSAAGIAGFAAGVVSFLAFLPFGVRKPGLLAEGAVFGVMAFLGAGLIHAEALMGILLLLSAFLRWNLPGRMAGGALKGLLGKDGVRVMSFSMGTVFLLHAVAYAILEREGVGGTVNGAILFAAMYFSALAVTSRRLRKRTAASRPVITMMEGETAVLQINASEVLTFILSSPGARKAVVEFLSPKVPDSRILKALSCALRIDGYDSVVITQWNGDSLDLEMDGFRETPGGWMKPLYPF